MEEQIRACCLAISLIRLFFKFFFLFPCPASGKDFLPRNVSGRGGGLNPWDLSAQKNYLMGQNFPSI